MSLIGSWQEDNVSNQREHVVHLLANEQSRFRIPDEPEPVSLILSYHIISCNINPIQHEIDHNSWDIECSLLFSFDM